MSINVGRQVNLIAFHRDGSIGPEMPHAAKDCRKYCETAGATEPPPDVGSSMRGAADFGQRGAGCRTCCAGHNDAMSLRTLVVG
jgi:hypothetical protein